MLDNFCPSNINSQWNGNYILRQWVSLRLVSFILFMRFCLPGTQGMEIMRYKSYMKLNSGAKIFWYRDKILDHSVKQSFSSKCKPSMEWKLHFETATVSTLGASLVKGKVIFILLIRFCLQVSEGIEIKSYVKLNSGCKIFWYRDKILALSVRQSFSFKCKLSMEWKLHTFWDSEYPWG